MASAKSILNVGNVISFVTPNTENNDYMNNAIFISDTFTAKIGQEIKQGERLSFQIDNCYIKNGEITSSDIVGDAVSIPDSTALGYQAQYYIDSGDCSATYNLSTDFNPKNDHKLLVAGYCTYGSGYSGTHNIVNMEFLFYDVDSQSVTASPLNTANAQIVVQDFGLLPQFKNESVNSGTISSSSARFNQFRYGLGYNFGTIGYAHNIKVAGFLLGTSYSTNIPLFDTQAHAEAYLRDNSITEGLLNASQTSPEEEYKNDQKYYHLKNLVARGGGSTWTPVINANYRFKPLSGKICLYKHRPTESAPYEWKLKNYSGYDIWKSQGVNYNDDEDYNLTENIITEFIENSLKFGTTNYRVNIFDTDIPTWETEQDADDYIAGLKDISECLNYDYIVRTNQEILGPDIGLADAGDDNGSNGMVYSYGSRMYVMTSSHLAGFFADVFNTANINDILDGTKLFGANQINAISGIMYFPCDISEFCSLSGSATPPHVGSWVCPNATSDGYVVKNDKLIDCGGAQLNPIYNDFRDLEPYNLLYVSLPFCGTHQLQLTKYLGKYISFKYSIDAVTGECACHVYGDGIEYDTFYGVCASQRPITAIDQTMYLSNVLGAVNSGLSAGTGVISSGAQAIGGVVTGNVGNIASGALGMGAGSAEGVFAGYNVMQAVDNPPMTTRGSASGCQGFFGCTRIHLHFFQKKTVKPMKSLALCGAPSNTSGTVSQFSGFLKCSTFKMSDSFMGTNDELNEIMQMMKNGIYV